MTEKERNDLFIKFWRESGLAFYAALEEFKKLHGPGPRAPVPQRVK